MLKWVFSLLLLLPAAAGAQGIAAIQNHCFQGGTKAQVSGLSSTNYQDGIIPSCTVTVFLTGTQTKAPIYAAATGTGSVSGVTITAGGNYSVCPTAATFTGTGSGATGTPVCVLSSVVSVTMISGGSGYSSAPTVAFTGGTGTGAAGTATTATTLSNPFTANTAASLDAGGWIFWAAVNQGYDIVLSGGIAPNTYATPITLTDRFPSFSFSGGSSGGAANIAHVLQALSGDGSGNAVGMPSKGTGVSGGVAWPLWNEDNGLDYAHGGGIGLFDPRDTRYDGGISGPTPGLAMQDMCNDLTCYQAITGLRGNVVIPPGTFPIGTPANPTLVCPTGAHYASASPNPNGVTSTLQATYNGHLALHFLTATAAVCSDSNTHTNTLTAGYYGGGIGVKGCAQGGCTNAPGDNTNYPNGGQNQNAVLIEDSGGEVDYLGAYENGGEGINVSGESTHTGTLWTASNMAWYYFGITQSGQTYNPTTDGWHCNVEYNSLDGTFDGPAETGGFLQTPGAEYQHVCGIFWGGGNTKMGGGLSNRDEIGLVRANFANGREVGLRIDAPMGEGFISQGGGNSFASMDNSSACSGFSTVGPGTVFGPWIATLGAGMTTGTYVVPSTGGGGTGATLTVTVAGGVATGITVSNAGSGYSSTPTFTMTGTGGTPATIGATTYQHCDKLDEQGAQNSFSNVKNIFESFFGTDHSTGDIWLGGVGTNDTFDRGTIGTYERVAGLINEPKGFGAHKDLLDPQLPAGGVGITGPTLNFSNGNHFSAGDTTPTSWTGPFTIASIMQDLWIWGNNANTTLPVSAGWQTCSGHDLNLVSPQWYHFLVFQDDNQFTVGTNFIFKEQCDTIFKDYLQPGFVWLATNSVLPTTDAQATLDAAGSVAVRPYPALGALTLTAAGSTSAFSYCFVIQVWVAGGKQTTGSVCGTKTPPATTTGLNNLFVNLTLPQNWTRYKVYLNSTTDGTFTPGVWYDTTSPNSLPQPVTTLRLPITTFSPTDTSTIATANLSLNMTGTYNVSIAGVPLPATSNTLCIPGQEIHSCSAGFDYTCTTEDHWVRNAITCSTF